MTFSLRNRLCSAFLQVSACLLFSHATQAQASYQKDVAPILENHCVKCHGEEKQKSGLRLDQRPLMLKGGDSGLPAVVPGKPEKSFLLEVISDPDHEIAMPPKGDRLTKEHITTLRTWIADGADWPGQMDNKLELKTDHWSFQPIVRPSLPSGSDNPLDAFLERKLKESGLAANKPADARSLIQRVHITITGLPPTPEEVTNFEQAFQANPKKAYTDLIDAQLESTHFGERWAQHWLDVIRWAETNGSESNLYRKNAWFYRDY
ncbi:DUF1549 domain-containing protein, partial [Akkermansiaceae bacterium]|nr:DUF1549 domain-containing protein [Akkermansiaceae bacterium]